MSNWYVIRTATRQERKVVVGLHEMAQEHSIDLDAYLPCETRWSRSGRVTSRRQTPLLPGYLFLSIDAAHLWRLGAVDGVYQVLRTAAGPMASADTDKLAMLRLAEVNGEFDFTKEPEMPVMEKGVRFSTKGGWIGELVAAPRNKRARLMVSMFGRIKIMNVPVGDLKPLDAAAA